MSDKEKIKTLHWMVALLIVALIVAGVYIVNNEINEDEMCVNPSCENSKENLNYLDAGIINALGMKLFENADIKEPYMKHFFEEKHMSSKSFSNEEKLHLAFQNLKNIKKTNNAESKLFENIDYDNLACNQDNCTVYFAESDSFKKEVEKLWGIDNNIKLEDFEITIEYVPYICSFDKKYVYCNEIAAAGADSLVPITEYYSTKTNGSDIVVSVKYILTDLIVGTSIYSDPNQKNEILLLQEDKEKLKDNYEYTKNELFEKYGDKAGLFEVTFKKDSAGNYYYYSTEYVE